MSYPKKHPAVQISERDQKQQQRKEQMRTLLINKFRGKYNITADNEKSDRIIRNEVDTFLQNEQLTEQNLIKLDKKINDIFGTTSSQNAHKKQKSIAEGLQQRDYNNSGQQLRESQDYNIGGSSVSSKHSIRTDSSRQSIGNGSQRSRSSVIKEVGNQIMQAPSVQNDDYWNKIIMHNVESFHKEQEDAKQRARDNQQRMKEELERQIHASKKFKEEEKKKELFYVEQMNTKSEEQKRQDQIKIDEMKKKLLQEKQVRDNQLREQSIKKSEDQKMEKYEDEERKRKVEKDSNDQILREKQKISGYKQQCQQQYQENIVSKEIRKKQEEEQNAVGSLNDNMLGNLFIEKKHISYEKRAQNDRKVELVKDKLMGDSLKRDQQIERSIDQVQKEKERTEKLQLDKKHKDVKAREIATKQFLDIQIQEKLQRSKLSKVTEQQEAKYIYKDVQVFETIEKQKKEGVQTTMKAHKESLEKQMQESKVKTSGMAQQEYMINKKILDTIDSKTNGSPQALSRKPF